MPKGGTNWFFEWITMLLLNNIRLDKWRVYAFGSQWKPLVLHNTCGGVKIPNNLRTIRHWIDAHLLLQLPVIVAALSFVIFTDRHENGINHTVLCWSQPLKLVRELCGHHGSIFLLLIYLALIKLRLCIYVMYQHLTISSLM